MTPEDKNDSRERPAQGFQDMAASDDPVMTSRSPNDAVHGCPIYMVFKYIENIERMEPRNMGVVVWHDGAVAGRILDDPPFIPAEDVRRHAYAQWVEYWKKQLESHSIEGHDDDHRDRVHVSSKKFLEVLQTHGKGNFILAYGGFIIDDVGRWEVSDIAEYLFGRLVL